MSHDKKELRTFYCMCMLTTCVNSDMHCVSHACFARIRRKSFFVSRMFTSLCLHRRVGSCRAKFRPMGNVFHVFCSLLHICHPSEASLAIPIGGSLIQFPIRRFMSNVLIVFCNEALPMLDVFGPDDACEKKVQPGSMHSTAMFAVAKFGLVGDGSQAWNNYFVNKCPGLVTLSSYEPRASWVPIDIICRGIPKPLSLLLLALFSSSNAILYVYFTLRTDFVTRPWLIAIDFEGRGRPKDVVCPLVERADHII